MIEAFLQECFDHFGGASNQRISGPIKCVSRLERIIDGHTQIDTYLWDVKDKLVAVARQLGTFKASPDAKL